jgi:hypothetical protein
VSNERNVAALAAQLHQFWENSEGGPHDDNAIARFLAARGVLVPASLTHDDVEQMTRGYENGIYYDGIHMGLPEEEQQGRAEMVARLERIARGEGGAG